MPPEAQTVLHTWCRQTEWNAPTIVGGAGARLLTADGRSILDMSSLAECSNLGHQHPRVVEAAAEQMCLLNTNTRYLNDKLTQYAERLTATLPDPLIQFAGRLVSVVTLLTLAVPVDFAWIFGVVYWPASSVA